MAQWESSRFLVPRRNSGPLPEATRVLFVDCEPKWGPRFTDALVGLPFQVELAQSAWQAIEISQKRGHAIAVIEARMPGIDGLALAERIMRFRPETAFVLSTTSLETALRVNHNIDGAIASLIRKPWVTEELHSVLHQAYDLHEKRLRNVGSARQPPNAVLIVEDNPGDAELIMNYLSDTAAGDITCVNNLGDAIGLLHERRFDVIITDLTLPDARGLDAVMRLQANAPSAALVVCSGISDDALAVQVVQLGAQEFLIKNDINARSLPRLIQFAKERKLAESRLVSLAHFDQLTGLANRSTFEYQAELALIRAQRLKGRFALLYIDLDKFKQVNDRLGHDAGDSLLQELAKRMSSAVREYDTVARLGGDEFGIVLPDVSNEDDIKTVATRLNQSLAAPFTLGLNRIESAASIGVAVYPDAGDNLSELLKQADGAMYACKRSGRNGFVFAQTVGQSATHAVYSWRSRSSIPPSRNADEMPTMPNVPNVPNVPKYFADP